MATGNYQYQHAVGLFSSHRDAEIALHQLRDAGFNMDKISVVSRTEGGNGSHNGPNADKSDQIAGGAGAGATAGAATGGLMGLIGSLGVLAIPGIGPAAEVGIILANTLLGGGIGAAGGGLIGALVGWGVPEDQANYYNDRVTQHGDYLILVEGTEQDMRNAQSVLSNYGIRDWNIYGSAGAQTAAGMPKSF
ncbi:hypothetical protein [Pseudanabaena sp. FACHB-2040]|uniref:hypothetical protein n=1 Tax=Pseudanabaena sp. FACHB-2040 TaxID=2692859 RepID=UPI0016860CB6|nr:hypothetical protein [Pseudanabaena sp. FACHB-2040]MBD2260758.1 hypothetical protein [Pseudanabaena sp. FACHB-2040]